jgi:hypothetical protein
MLLKSAQDSDLNSLSHRMRARRFQQFSAAIAHLPKPVRVLDVGGTSAFWQQRGYADSDQLEIVTVNLVAEPQQSDNIKPTVGDATQLPFEDGSFDVAFSNSVIEHLFDRDAQTRMSNEVRRVGHAFWVQTPNFWFPIEPHFLTPGWQWLPVRTRVAILQRRAVGQMAHTPEPDAAKALIQEVRLLRRREMRQLFPNATLIAEHYMGLVKSWTAVGGLPVAETRRRFSRR